MRVAATSILNINITAANLDTFTETMVSWRRERELSQKAMTLTEVLYNLKHVMCFANYGVSLAYMLMLLGSVHSLCRKLALFVAMEMIQLLLDWMKMIFKQ